MKQFNLNSIKLKITKDNTKRNKVFEHICTMTQAEVKKYVSKKLSKYGKVIKKGDGWVYKEGTVPILLVAHMDTVHKHTPREIKYINGFVSSPEGIGGDDRCGIYMILEIIKKHNCHVLFVEDEEIGCVGSSKFTKTNLCNELKNTFNYIIELDRHGEKDAVFYECANKEFTDFITQKYWQEKVGSYSDIAELSPALECASVNLSCGYFNEHSSKETVSLEIMENNIKQVCSLIERSTDTFYEYIEASYCYLSNSYYNYDYGEQDKECIYMIWFTNQEEKEDCYAVQANNTDEALGIFFYENPTICFNDILDIDEQKNI